MSKGRTNSSPDLNPLLADSNLVQNGLDDTNLQGLAANVKLLLKLIEDHNEACTKDYDGRRTQRVAGMITILDEVKSRIQRSQSLVSRRNAELRRCNTELRPRQNSIPPRDKRPQSPVTDEREMLRRELSSCMAARKSLEKMFSSLGKEKEIMAAELARKAHELNGMEEHLSDLRAQNDILLAKVHACAAEHQGRRHDSDMITAVVGGENNTDLQERNKTLSEQLLKSLDRYRSLKRKLREAQEEKECAHAKVVEVEEHIEAGRHRVTDLRERIIEDRGHPVDIEAELVSLENMFRTKVGIKSRAKTYDNPIMPELKF